MHRRSLPTRVSLCLVLAYSMAGCYRSHRRPMDADADAAIVPDAGDSLLDEQLPSLVEALCARVERCAGPAAFVFTQDSCRTYLGDELRDAVGPLWKQAVAEGSLRLRPENLADCTDAIARESCADGLSGLPEGCDAYLRGMRGAGESCLTSEDCAGGSICVTAVSCPGTCRARPTLGETCDAGCATGFVCDASDTCQPSASVELPCGPGFGACPARLLTCIGDTSSTPGICRPWVEAYASPAGARCDPVFDDLCRPPSVCALVSGTRNVGEGVWRCEGPYAAGGSCHGAYPDGCPGGQFWDVDPRDELMGVCRPLPGPGMLCASTGFTPGQRVCQTDVACDGRTCRRRARVGEACTGDIVCTTFRCRDDVCQAPECLP